MIAVLSIRRPTSEVQANSRSSESPGTFSSVACVDGSNFSCATVYTEACIRISVLVLGFRHSVHQRLGCSTVYSNACNWAVAGSSEATVYTETCILRCHITPPTITVTIPRVETQSPFW